MSQQVNDSVSLAEKLNHTCTRSTLNSMEMTRLLGGVMPPTMFASLPVFIESHQLQAMQNIIAAIESVIALPAYQEQVLRWAPDIATKTNMLNGVCMGYDFHIRADGPKLIEINTNAGGVMLNAKLLQAQQRCCDAVFPVTDHDMLAKEILAMFLAEWRRQRGDSPLRTIAILDENPIEQFLFPEFELFADLFESAGLQAIIADPRQLTLSDGALWHDRIRVDMIYNRLTDFDLSTDACAVLREAYLQDNVVLTPNPHHHALYADKRNLTLLSNATALEQLGVDHQTRHVILNAIPRTVFVEPEQHEQFWADRDHWFFKPSSGYGGKAVYRGDKITRKVFANIIQGGYLAQSMALPGERYTGETGVMKVDWRNFTYHGKIQLIAARIYQGQTTNFRTKGGGFAAVYQPEAGSFPACQTQ